MGSPDSLRGGTSSLPEGLPASAEVLRFLQASCLGVPAAGPSKAWAEGLLDKGRILVDMPSLAQPNAMLMSDTALQNTFTCQPQQRNIHGRVFGGFLMRWLICLTWCWAQALLA